ncbi:MAG: MoaD/ThiS family protein [Gammaproteobacteria bacterium]|nr:MoaD/ThiS family protein [Gammaproteobacteria bacterium]
MNVTVRFFASLREVIDHETMDLQLPGSTLASVRDQLRCRLDATQWEAICAAGVQVAVNQRIVRGDAALASGDEVAFLPPVTGG